MDGVDTDLVGYGTVFEHVIPDVSRDHIAFIFSVRYSKKIEYEGTRIILNVGKP